MSAALVTGQHLIAGQWRPTKNKSFESRNPARFEEVLGVFPDATTDEANDNALAALQKTVASQKAVETAQRSYDLSKKRYDVNLLTSFELITNQNNLFKAQIDLLLARYDYIFKMKLLEFYKGQGLQM